MGCTATGTGTDPTEVTTATSNPLLTRHPLAYPGPPATVGIGNEGILHIDTESYCVVLDDEAGDSRVIAFSEDRAVTIDLSDPLNPVVIVDGCRPLRDGESVPFYGAGVFPDRAVLEEQLDLADLQRCSTSVEELLLVGDCYLSSRSQPADRPGVSP